MNKLKRLNFWIFILILILFVTCKNPNECIIGSWCYPDCNNENRSEWIFNSDGKFLFTEKFFDIKHSGNWKINENENIQISYTNTNDNSLPKNEVLILKDCNTFQSSATVYRKESN